MSLRVVNWREYRIKSIISRIYYIGSFFDDVFRQLGFEYGTAKKNSYYGAVPSDFAMDEVYCYHEDDFLQDCEYNTSDDCGSSEGAGVYCYNQLQQSP